MLLHTNMLRRKTYRIKCNFLIANLQLQNLIDVNEHIIFTSGVADQKTTKSNLQYFICEHTYSMYCSSCAMVDAFAISWS